MDDAVQHIATVAKNKAEDVRIALTEWQGVDLVDIRVFAAFDGAAERRATKKGVALHVSRIPELLEALEAARAAAERRGLIPEAGHG